MLSKQVKHLPEDGTIPRQAQFTCLTCKTWFASRTGHYGHINANPGHKIFNVRANRPVTYRSASRPSNLVAQPSTNGHRAVTTVLLQSAFAKLREEVTAELDRLEAQLFPAGQPAERQPRKTYVAR